MKKNIIKCAIGAIVIAAIAGIIYAAVTINKEKKEADKHLVEISIGELQEKVNNKDTFILVVTKDGCSYCESYKPVIKDVLEEYDVVAYELNQTKLTTKEDQNAYEELVPNITGTPTTVFFKNGEEITVSNRLIGAVKRDKVVDRLKALGYITEKK